MVNLNWFQILIHPAGKIRLGFLAAIRGLLSKSSCLLKGARLVMLVGS